MPEELTSELPTLVSESAPESKDQLQEMTELLQRTQANFENYRKQMEKRVEEIKQLAAKDIVLQLLPVLDNFELAFRNQNHNPQEFIKGIELIYVQLKELLEHQGVKAIPALGKFNPYYHEALLKVESELPENTILEEFQRGFTLQGQVIRPVRVKISSGPTKNKIHMEE